MSHLSVINPKAKLGKGVKVEPFATIAANVEIGEGTWIGSNAIIMDGVRIGKNCKIFPGAVVGAIPQDLKYKGENTQIVIGDNVTVREYCTLNKGTSHSGTTYIGSNSLLMAYVHVAHDCVLGENVILANAVNLAGHVHIENNVIIGGIAAVHQFVKIGAYTMVGGGSLVRKDVPPFIKASREPLSYVGVNSIGLRRNGFSNERIRKIQEIYRILFIKGYAISKAVAIIKRDLEDSDDKLQILEFLNQSERGIIRGLRTAR
jgi:UDP-N-acetylglucosamine acyltransferase